MLNILACFTTVVHKNLRFTYSYIRLQWLVDVQISNDNDTVVSDD